MTAMRPFKRPEFVPGVSECEQRSEIVFDEITATAIACLRLAGNDPEIDRAGTVIIERWVRISETDPERIHIQHGHLPNYFLQYGHDLLASGEPTDRLRGSLAIDISLYTLAKRADKDSDYAKLLLDRAKTASERYSKLFKEM